MSLEDRLVDLLGKLNAIMPAFQQLNSLSEEQARIKQEILEFRKQLEKDIEKIKDQLDENGKQLIDLQLNKLDKVTFFQDFGVPDLKRDLEELQQEVRDMAKEFKNNEKVKDKRIWKIIELVVASVLGLIGGLISTKLL